MLQLQRLGFDQGNFIRIVTLIDKKGWGMWEACMSDRFCFLFCLLNIKMRINRKKKKYLREKFDGRTLKILATQLRL